MLGVRPNITHRIPNETPKKNEVIAMAIRSNAQLPNPRSFPTGTIAAILRTSLVKGRAVDTGELVELDILVVAEADVAI